jgi:hypothetical protein
LWGRRDRSSGAAALPDVRRNRLGADTQAVAKRRLSLAITNLPERLERAVTARLCTDTTDVAAITTWFTTHGHVLDLHRGKDGSHRAAFPIGERARLFGIGTNYLEAAAQAREMLVAHERRTAVGTARSDLGAYADSSTLDPHREQTPNDTPAAPTVTP